MSTEQHVTDRQSSQTGKHEHPSENRSDSAPPGPGENPDFPYPSTPPTPIKNSNPTPTK